MNALPIQCDDAWWFLQKILSTFWLKIQLLQALNECTQLYGFETGLRGKLVLLIPWPVSMYQSHSSHYCTRGSVRVLKSPGVRLWASGGSWVLSRNSLGRQGPSSRSSLSAWRSVSLSVVSPPSRVRRQCRGLPSGVTRDPILGPGGDNLQYVEQIMVPWYTRSEWDSNSDIFANQKWNSTKAGNICCLFWPSSRLSREIRDCLRECDL